MIMVEIREVKTKKEQKEFIEFPLNLYKGNPYFVPPLYSDEKKMFRKDFVYADAGKDVTVVDIKPVMAWAGAKPMHLFLRLGLLKQKGVKMLPETAVVTGTEKGVLLRSKDGKEYECEADTVIVALGKHPDAELVDALSSVVPETYVIGTARQDGEVFEATHEAYFAAMNL